MLKKQFEIQPGLQLRYYFSLIYISAWMLREASSIFLA